MSFNDEADASGAVASDDDAAAAAIEHKTNNKIRPRKAGPEFFFTGRSEASAGFCGFVPGSTCHSERRIVGSKLPVNMFQG